MQLSPPPAPAADPILPSLRSIRAAFDDYRRNPAAAAPGLRSLLDGCIRDFADDPRYADDSRFLNVWILYADVTGDFERVFRMMEMKGICQNHAALYEAYAMIHLRNHNLLQADHLYRTGIKRNAQPLDALKKQHAAFLKHVAEISVPVPEENFEYGNARNAIGEGHCSHAMKENPKVHDIDT